MFKRIPFLFTFVFLFVISTAVSTGAFKLPDTGQAKCYQAVSPYGEIPCPAPGEPLAQDGSYNINPLSYTDNGNGTVTDNNTGLMWQKQDDGQTYNWYVASGTYDATYNPTSQDVCGSLNLGDHLDWRLPTKKELVSIVDYDYRNYPWPAMDTTYFPNAKWFDYWSSTTRAYYPVYAWYVHFYGGTVYFGDKYNRYNYVRCVRGGRYPDQSFVDNEDGTVTDNVTGLIWQQGEPGCMTWDSALSYCEGLSLGGHSDCRLPNIKEIESLSDDERSHPAIDTNFFPNAYTSCNALGYWSSTAGVASGVFYPNTALYVSDYGSGVSYGAKYLRYYVRCVCDGVGGGGMPGPVIISPLEITPEKDEYFIGDNINAGFTIRNESNAPVTFNILTVGGRLNGWCPSEGCPDFTHRSLTLQPYESYQYEGSLTLTESGNYHFFVAYYIENPTPDEKRLLDENNWNTQVNMGAGLTHADRIKNIDVFRQEPLPPNEVSELKDKVKRELQRKVTFPPYLPDPNSFTNAVATTWASFTSWITQTELIEKYDEVYQTGIDYEGLRFKALKDALDSVNIGDIDSTKKYLHRSYTYERASAMSFAAAADVFEKNLEAAQILANGIKDGCEASVKFGLAVTNPVAAKAADYLYIGGDYVVDRILYGQEEAYKNAVVSAAVTVLFNEVPFDDLGGRTIADYTNNQIGKVTFPLLQKLFKNKAGVQFLLSKAIKECGVQIEEAVAEDIAKGILNELEKIVNMTQAMVKSPVELRVRDSLGNITGLLNGKVEHGISASVYGEETVVILYPLDSYYYEVVGTANGVYGFEVTFLKDGETNIFTATDIPTESGEIHEYTIDWDALSRGEEGVTVKIDSNGDGQFERRIISDNVLTEVEFKDTTSPIIDISGCPLKVNLDMSTSITINVTDSESGVAYQSEPNGTKLLDTSSVGVKIFTVKAQDNSGNEGSNSCTYQVIYDFTGAGGFQPPVDDPPVTNTAKAGSSIPVKWKLPNGKGGFISDLGAVISIQFQQAACSNFSNIPTDPVETTATGGTGLRYDLTANQFVYNWQTSKTQAGKCYTLNLKLNDGSLYKANFSLK